MSDLYNNWNDNKNVSSLYAEKDSVVRFADDVVKHLYLNCLVMEKGLVNMIVFDYFRLKGC